MALLIFLPSPLFLSPSRCSDDAPDNNSHASTSRRLLTLREDGLLLVAAVALLSAPVLVAPQAVSSRTAVSSWLFLMNPARLRPAFVAPCAAPTAIVLLVSADMLLQPSPIRPRRPPPARATTPLTAAPRSRPRAAPFRLSRSPAACAASQRTLWTAWRAWRWMRRTRCRRSCARWWGRPRKWSRSFRRRASKIPPPCPAPVASESHAPGVLLSGFQPSLKRDVQFGFGVTCCAGQRGRRGARGSSICLSHGATQAARNEQSTRLAPPRHLTSRPTPPPPRRLSATPRQPSASPPPPPMSCATTAGPATSFAR